MTDTRTTVLACIDGSTHQQATVDYASWVARTVTAPLKFLHNLEHREPAPSDLSGSLVPGAREELLQELTDLEARRSKILLEQGKLMLENAARRAQTLGVTDITRLQRHGGLIDSLIEMEREIRVLVVGIRGEEHDTDDNKLGNHIEAIIRSLHRPVLVVNQPFTTPPQRCMLAYDGSEAAQKALNMMVSSPLFKGVECHLVNVSRDEESPVLQQPAQQLEKAGFNVVTNSLHGDVEKQLLDYQSSKDIELTVMGAFGHSRLRELLFGSITHRMLSHSKVPLLLLR